MNTVDVLGAKFFSGSIYEAVEWAFQAMSGHGGKYVVAPDSELLLAARKKQRLMDAIDGAELVLPAGSGIMYASHILGTPLKEKITALDFASALMARMGENGMRLFILAQEAGLVEPALRNVRGRYPGIRAGGCSRDGCASGRELTERIELFEPDLLLVCLDPPRQELWISRRGGNIKAGLMLGYGNELRILAGAEEEIPQKWREAGYEWLYRLIREPRLILRMLRRTGIIFAAIGRRLLG